LTGPKRPLAPPNGGGPLHQVQLILALVFLLAFAVYYFSNWKLLSVVWQVG
jgi:hypothetical protein